MMDRRSFLVVSAGSLQAQAAMARSSKGRIYQRAAPSSYQFLVQPGITARYDLSTQKTSDVVPWAFFSKSGVDIANVVSPQTYAVEQLETWAQQRGGACCTPGSSTAAASSDPLDFLMTVRLVGIPSVSDIEAAMVGSVVDRVALDISLDFIAPTASDFTPAYALTNVNGVPVWEGPTSSLLPQLQPGSGPQPEVNAPPSVELFGWRLQFRGPETHPLGSCVSAPVTHFNIEIFRATGGGRYAYATNFHLGTYRSGGRRCFVLYNNIQPIVCWKTCGPTMGDLAGMFRWMLTAAAAVLAVAVAAWIVAVIAEAAASVAFAPLLLLA